ncbi:hypothetical protein K503DRAFT_769465, partial [Rhizopogon vinicolor AM-OR11-026]
MPGIQAERGVSEAINNFTEDDDNISDETGSCIVNSLSVRGHSNGNQDSDEYQKTHGEYRVC